MATKPTKPKRESKGKQHPLHAESFDMVATALDGSAVYLTSGQLAKILRDEAKRVRSIVR